MVWLLPGDAPRSVLVALDLLPLECWGAEEPARGAASVEARRSLPGAICSPVRRLLATLLAPPAELPPPAALVVSAVCDSLIGLGSLVRDLQPLPWPVITHHLGEGGWLGGERLPGGQDPADAAAAFSHAELELFIQACEQVAGHSLDEARLGQALLEEEEVERLSREVLRRRAGVWLGEREQLRRLRAAEYLLPQDAVRLLQGTLEELDRLGATAHATLPQDRARQPVLLSGVVAEPLDWLDLFEQANLTVVGVDLLGLGRRWVPERRAMARPADVRSFSAKTRLLQRLGALPPAPHRVGPARPRRGEWLLSEVHRCSARGVVVLLPRGCEPEAFGLAELREVFSRARVPWLVLEHEVGSRPGSSAGMRLEAFAELLGGACPAQAAEGESSPSPASGRGGRRW